MRIWSGRGESGATALRPLLPGTGPVSSVDGILSGPRMNGVFGLPLLIGVALGTLTIDGCATPSKIQSTPSDKHIVLFPGISGPDLRMSRSKRMIESDVAGSSAQVLDWTSLVARRTLLGNLTDAELNRARAAAISDELQAWRAEHPNSRLYLIGLSGGAGMILFTCEALPDDFSVERIILLSGAVSSDYDLTRALRMSRRGVVSYSSRLDAPILNLGTRFFGTLDRKHVPSAGYAGLTGSPADEFRHKLIEIYWEAEDVRLGNLGGHFGSLARAYFRQKILPFVTDSGIEREQALRGNLWPFVRKTRTGTSRRMDRPIRVS